MISDALRDTLYRSIISTNYSNPSDRRLTIDAYHAMIRSKMLYTYDDITHKFLIIMPFITYLEWVGYFSALYLKQLTGDAIDYHNPKVSK